VGKPVSEIDFRGMRNILLVAVKKISGEWIYNPYPGTVLEHDMSLIVLATAEERELLQTLCSEGINSSEARH
jgi:K+/H+ antiporter YhaU regulatory subunit KhtT